MELDRTSCTRLLVDRAGTSGGESAESSTAERQSLLLLEQLRKICWVFSWPSRNWRCKAAVCSAIRCKAIRLSCAFWSACGKSAPALRVGTTSRLRDRRAIE